MACRLDHLFHAGELDNTQLGWTIGWLELSGFQQRLELKLVGNCHPDLAGWTFRIKRVLPELTQKCDGDEAPNYSGINRDQSGHVGDITADQMIKHFEIPTDELIVQLQAGQSPPFTWRKCLYLEWFSNRNGRIVIQSTRLEIERIGERAFELTDQQYLLQRQQNQHEMNYFMTQLSDAISGQSEEAE